MLELSGGGGDVTPEDAIMYPRFQTYELSCNTNKRMMDHVKQWMEMSSADLMQIIDAWFELRKSHGAG